MEMQTAIPDFSCNIALVHLVRVMMDLLLLPERIVGISVRPTHHAPRMLLPQITVRLADHVIFKLVARWLLEFQPALEVILHQTITHCISSAQTVPGEAMQQCHTQILQLHNVYVQATRINGLRLTQIQ